MLVVGIVLNIIGIGLLCWLIFTLAVYALPFFIAVSAGMMAFHGGAGVAGGLVIGLASGTVALAIGQAAFTMTRSMSFRAAIAAAFAAPAAIAGYQAVLVMSQIGVPSLVWREIFACFGALLVAGTTWTRLTAFAVPRQASSARRSKLHLSQF
jgi:hypothetical protein